VSGRKRNGEQKEGVPGAAESLSFFGWCKGKNQIGGNAEPVVPWPGRKELSFRCGLVGNKIEQGLFSSFKKLEQCPMEC